MSASPVTFETSKRKRGDSAAALRSGIALLGVLVGCAPRVPAKTATATATTETSTPVSVERTPPQAVSEARAESCPPPEDTKPITPTTTAEERVLNATFRLSNFSSLHSVATGGQWLTYCAKPEANAEAAPNLELRFSHPDENGTLKAEPILELLAASGSGRFAVIENAEGTFLVDATDPGKRESLRPKRNREGRTAREAVAFADDENTLAFLEEDGRRLTLLALAERKDEPSGRKHLELALPDPNLRLEYQNDWLVLRGGTIPEATPKGCAEARFFADFPALREPMAEKREKIWLIAPGEEVPVPAPGFLTILGDGFVRRDENARLLYVSEGTEQELTTAACGARILGARTAESTLAIVCEEFRPRKKSEPLERPKARGKGKAPPVKLKFPVYLVGPKYRKSLEIETMRTGTDVVARGEERFVPLRVGAEATLIDLLERKLVRLGNDAFVISVFGEGAFVLKNEDLYRYESPALVPLLKRSSPFEILLTSGRSYLSGRSLSSNANELVTLAEAEAPLALTSEGVLLARGKGDEFRFLRGSATELKGSSTEARPPAAP